MIKETTHEEDITLLNMCASNNKGSKYMKQKGRTGRKTNLKSNYCWKFQYYSLMI